MDTHKISGEIVQAILDKLGISEKHFLMMYTDTTELADIVTEVLESHGISDTDLTPVDTEFYYNTSENDGDYERHNEDFTADYSEDIHEEFCETLAQSNVWLEDVERTLVNAAKEREALRKRRITEAYQHPTNYDIHSTRDLDDMLLPRPAFGYT